MLLPQHKHLIYLWGAHQGVARRACFLLLLCFMPQLTRMDFLGESLWFLEAVTGVWGAGLAAPTPQETWAGGD